MGLAVLGLSEDPPTHDFVAARASLRNLFAIYTVR